MWMLEKKMGIIFVELQMNLINLALSQLDRICEKICTTMPLFLCCSMRKCNA